jgi:hypothetical protein
VHLIARPAGGERPDSPFTGFKLARAVLSADGMSAGFGGLTIGAERVYGAVAEATCVWNDRHVPPKRWCGCGFYCLHDLSDAKSLGCTTENRSALLLEVTASGRYIRYERGLRYSRQRVRSIRAAWCACGRPGVALTDAGTGLVGWRHLDPVCERCAAGRLALRMSEFAGLIGGPTLLGGRVEVAPAPVAASPDLGTADAEARIAESPIAVLTAEIALLHARLDDLQARFERGRLPRRFAAPFTGPIPPAPRGPARRTWPAWPRRRR